MKEITNKKIVIIGASASGLKCACRLKRLRPDFSITVFDTRREFSFAGCGLPYAVSQDVDDIEKLRKTSDGMMRDERYFEKVKGIEVRGGHKAVSINPRERSLLVRAEDNEYKIEWDEIVIATGAIPRRIQGQLIHDRIMGFRTLEDAKKIVGLLEKGLISKVVIIGAGPIGIELTEAFRALWGIDVDLIEAKGMVLPMLLSEEMAGVVEKELVKQGVSVHLNSAVTRFEVRDNLVRVFTTNGVFEGDLAIVGIGVDPVVDLAVSAGVKLGITGAIQVDERMATSVPHIWAVGDCIEVRHAITEKPTYMPLGSLANLEGRVLANILAGREDCFPPVVGSMAIKVFDLNVACTGLTRHQAHDFSAFSVWVSSYDRAGYMPEAKEIFLEMTYDHKTHRVLGVQCIGEGEVTKRVDIAARIISQKGKIEDLTHLEHAYAPPYAPSLDPLAYAGFCAENQEDGVAQVSPMTDFHGYKVLDVRHREEVSERPSGAEDPINIPLEELREKVSGLEKGLYLVICERGGRSFEACNILKNHGIDCFYLGGGLHLRNNIVKI